MYKEKKQGKKMLRRKVRAQRNGEKNIYIQSPANRKNYYFSSSKKKGLRARTTIILFAPFKVKLLFSCRKIFKNFSSFFLMLKKV